MKVLLIQMPGRKQDLPIVPIGLCYISDALSRQGHHVTILDPNVSDRLLEEDLTGLKSRQDFDIIGVSLRNIDNNLMDDLCYYYENLTPILQMIHQLFPDAKLMIGGPGYSIFAEIIMQRNPLLDYGIYQQGIESVVELLENLTTPEKVSGIHYRQNDKVYFSGTRNRPDINSLPSDPWKLIDLQKYVKFEFAVGVVSKMGCVFKCSYCTYPKLSGGTISIRKPELIVDDIETLVNKYGVKEFFFVDSMFNFPQEEAIAVCNEIIRRKLKVKWTAYFIEKYFNQEILDLAMAAGCNNFSFSPDGIHDKAMKGLGKANNEEDLYRVYNLIKNTDGASAGFSFFLNPPGQDLMGFIKSIRFFFMTKILHRKKFTHCSFWYPRVYPHTPLHDLAAARGVIPESAEKLLPESKEELEKLFYMNSDNNYLNFLYKHVLTPIQAVRQKLRKKKRCGS